MSEAAGPQQTLMIPFPALQFQSQSQLNASRLLLPSPALLVTLMRCHASCYIAVSTNDIERWARQRFIHSSRASSINLSQATLPLLPYPIRNPYLACLLHLEQTRLLP